jgi:hypothetical protein
MEDMLRMYVMDNQTHWDKYLPLVKFTYNNSFHSSIGIPPYKALYGRPCRTQLSWERLEDRVTVGPELIQEMEEQVIQIRKRRKESKDRQKLYVDAHRTDQSYKVGDQFFIHIRPNKSTIQFRKGTKLSPRFIGSFKIQERIGPVAYRLILSPHFHKTHNVFHVYVLRHYVVDESHKLNWKGFQVSDAGTLMVKPLCILDRRVRQLMNHLVDQVKVQWDKYSPGSTTSEDAKTLRRDHPSLLTTLGICFPKVGCM